jgi:acetylornithine deacetylase/succinyl-diaminopimelate desuccinylase-like protein
MLDVDAVVVLDTDDFEIIVAQKGLLHVKIRIEGKKAHGAYPWLGDNAIDRAAAVIADVGKYRFPVAPANKYLRPATVNTGKIHGGDKVNIVAGWCELELDFRFLPGMSASRILSDLTKIVRRRAKKFTLSHSGVQKPYVISEKHPLVACLSSAMRSCRVKPRIQGSEGATVITFFQDKKIPAIATGFGSAGCAHLTDEYVRVDNLARGALVLEKFLLSYKFD